MVKCIFDKVDIADALRYAGVRAPDPATEGMARDCLRELAGCAMPRSVWRRLAFESRADGVYIPERGVFFPGDDLKRVLGGCAALALFCATLGAEVDALIRREQYRDMARAVVIDACASAAVEVLCDEVEAEIASACGGAALTPRFSPGYGDLPLEANASALDLLDAAKTAGVHVTPGGLLVPMKSVVGVVGQSR